MGKKITLQDIAKELDISKGTVDRAIHNRPGISPETKEKVLQLIKKYDYTPDRIARSLSLKSKKVRIGVIYQTAPDFFWHNVRNGIEAAGSEFGDFGLEVVHKELKELREPREILDHMDDLIQMNVDALALVPLNSTEIREKVNATVEKGIPVATLNDDVSDSKRLFYVGPQMRQSGRIAGELMGKFLKGESNVVTLNGNINSLEYQERLEGFREVIAECYRHVHIVANYTYDYGKLPLNGNAIIKGLLESIDDLNGIYDVDGSSLHDIGNIIKNSKRLSHIVLIGHEVWSGVRDLVDEGVIHACISQDPYSQGYYIIKLLFDYLIGDVKPKFDKMYTRLDIILKENMIYQNNIINPYFIK